LYLLNKFYKDRKGDFKGKIYININKNLRMI